MLSLRSLRLADGVQVLALNAGARPHVAALDDTEFNRLVALSRAHLVTLEGKRIVGYALTFARDDAYDGEEFLEFRSLRPGPFTYVDQVVVLESARGRGIGRRFYEAIQRAARNRGAACLCC